MRNACVREFQIWYKWQLRIFNSFNRLIGEMTRISKCGGHSSWAQMDERNDDDNVFIQTITQNEEKEKKYQ